MCLLFYRKIVSPSYCQYLLESGDTAGCGMCYLINLFFLLGDHVLKEAEPWKKIIVIMHLGFASSNRALVSSESQVQLVLCLSFQPQERWEIRHCLAGGLGTSSLSVQVATMNMGTSGRTLQHNNNNYKKNLKIIKISAPFSQ